MCEAIRCDFGAVCELGEDGFPRCTCQFNCSTAVANSVCGSDLKLYVNDCVMRREGCHRQTELRPRPMELCEGAYMGYFFVLIFRPCWRSVACKCLCFIYYFECRD